jgi:hypothetical protein
MADTGTCVVGAALVALSGPEITFGNKSSKKYPFVIGLFFF